MKFKILFAILVCPLLSFAAKEDPNKADGEYRAERDPSEPALTIELRNGAITGKLASSNPENTEGTSLRGEYFILRDVVTLRFDRVTCKLTYKEDGLELLPAGGKRPALCKNGFKKIK